MSHRKYYCELKTVRLQQLSAEAAEFIPSDCYSVESDPMLVEHAQELNVVAQADDVAVGVSQAQVCAAEMRSGGVFFTPSDYIYLLHMLCVHLNETISNWSCKFGQTLLRT